MHKSKCYGNVLKCSTHFYFFGLPLISTLSHLVVFCSWENVSFLSDIQFVFYCRGWQGLIAQGCHSSILIIDPKTAQTIQVLEKHKSNVVKVRAHCEYLLITLFLNLATPEYSPHGLQIVPV